MNRLKKICAGLIVSLLLLPLAAQAGTASAEESLPPKARVASEVLRGTEPDAYIIDGCTYVPFRAYCEVLGSGAGNVLWDDASGTASYRSSSLSVTAKIGSPMIVANGRYLYRAPVLLIGGRTYVPLTLLAKAFGSSAVWNSGTGVVSMARAGKAIESGASFYNADDVYWLSRVIRAEAEGEPMIGKIAVGNVVLNRVKSPDFPNSVYGVIFDTRGGSVQFYRPGDSRMAVTPTEDCVIAAKICLDGYTVSDRTLFYLNLRTASSFWIPQNRPYLFDIGLHSFYA